MIEIFIFVASILMYRYFRVSKPKRHQFSQTEFTRVHRGTQTERDTDSMSVDLSDMELDEFFFSNKL
jgi:hypothetical protein